MTNFEWPSAVELGHPEIDEQHKRLLLLASAVANPPVNSVDQKPDAAQVQALIEFAQEHFSFEEDLMRSVGYPEAERHAKYHVALLTELKTYWTKVDKGMDTRPTNLNNFLWSWLLLHIDTVDRDLAVWLKSQ